MEATESVLATLGLVVMLASFAGLLIYSAADRMRRKRVRRAARSRDDG